MAGGVGKLTPSRQTRLPLKAGGDGGAALPWVPPGSITAIEG